MIEVSIETPVLLVSARNEYEGLGRCLRSYGLDVQRASNRRQTRGLLAGNTRFDFVITAEHLPDGNWRVLRSAARAIACRWRRLGYYDHNRWGPGGGTVIGLGAILLILLIAHMLGGIR
jgi:hypothetical protein